MMFKHCYKILHITILIISSTIFTNFVNAAERTELDVIKDRGFIKVGMCTIEQKPFYYKDKNGNLVGIDVNIANEIAKELNVKLEIVQDRDSWDALVQDVADGRTDLAISYISFTPARSQIVRFSQPYTTVSLVFTMNRSAISKAAAMNMFTLEDIFNDPSFPLYTYEGSSYKEMAHSLFPKVKIYPDSDVTAKVLSGEAAAFFTDDLDVSTYFIANPEYKLHLVNYPLKGYSDVIAIPVHYDNDRLLSLVNSILRTRSIDYTTKDLIIMLQKTTDKNHKHTEEDKADEHIEDHH